MEREASSAASDAKAVMPLCFLVAVLEGYDLQVISSAGPHLMRIMHLSPQQIGTFFSASLLGLAIGSIAGGMVADRIGRKPALLASMVVLGIFTFASALANSFEVMLVIRVLAGIGLGGAMPTLIALMAEYAGGVKTTSAVTTIICGHPTGGMISGFAGKLLAETYGWQSLFLTGGLLTLLVLPLLVRGLPETRPPTASRAAMPMATALFGEGRTAGTLLLWLTFILTLALMSVLLSWTPLFVMGKGLPRFVGFNAIIAINIGGILGGLLISRLIDRVGPRWPLLGLYAITAISLYGFAYTQTFGMLMVMAAITGFGVLGAQFSLYGVAPQLYPISGRGSGVGFAVAMGRIGAIAGPILVGKFLGEGSSEDQAILIMAPIALLAGIVFFAMTCVSHKGAKRG
jgi:MFS transporter, AAHS family, 3-hydroxyphenylpropionic acid transporter